MEPVVTSSAVHVVRSAVWSAFGDALGFISELAGESQLRRRISADRVETTVRWRRRVGGKFGVDVVLPAGCYSDDTQLRLATCRAIRGNGVFDVEAFAKVEVPVWLSYGLGGGRGTKAAATALIRREVTWATNFFHEKARYVDGGGNGAAMRIQPHVWAAPHERSDDDVLLDVLRNSVVTHGHPKALIGAAVHALTLRRTLRDKRIPVPAHLEELPSMLRRIPEILRRDEQLRSLWLPMWEREAGRPFDAAFSDAMNDHDREVRRAMQVRDAASATATYAELVRDLGGFEDKSRGTGTTTAVLSAVLAWLFAERPLDGLVAAANLLHSDTDTIGSMAGALLGVVADASPPGPVCDREYIGFEAKRLHGLSQGREDKSFPYPDLLQWHAPRTQAEAVYRRGDEWGLAGLGPLSPGQEVGEQSGAVWQWFTMKCGQSMLLKRRAVVVEHAIYEVETKPSAPPVERPLDETQVSEQLPLHMGDDAASLAQEVIDSGFDPLVAGRALRGLLDGPDGEIRAVEFTLQLARARRATRHRA